MKWKLIQSTSPKEIVETLNDECAVSAFQYQIGGIVTVIYSSEEEKKNSNSDEEVKNKNRSKSKK